MLSPSVTLSTMNDPRLPLLDGPGMRIRLPTRSSVHCCPTPVFRASVCNPREGVPNVSISPESVVTATLTSRDSRIDQRWLLETFA